MVRPNFRATPVRGGGRHGGQTMAAAAGMAV
jgi:hypothetical protein